MRKSSATCNINMKNLLFDGEAWCSKIAGGLPFQWIEGTINGNAPISAVLVVFKWLLRAILLSVCKLLHVNGSISEFLKY